MTLQQKRVMVQFCIKHKEALIGSIKNGSFVTMAINKINQKQNLLHFKNNEICVDDALFFVKIYFGAL